MATGAEGVIRILTGDCRAVLKTLADASVDSIVTDPPYELGFMGKGWDSTGVANEPAMWRECLRVLRPGGHLLAFSGTRTQHRMVCAIEDAGFEIRDQAGWMYGSGFPKNLDVSKAIDKAAGAVREVVAEGKAVKRMIPGADQNDTGSWIKDNGREYVPTVTAAAATDAAKQWDGWGTALKPAWEPICVARKPLIGTVVANVLKHGTGALNIDGCRVDGDPAGAATLGRWPANLLHDGSPEVVALFPAEAGAAAPVTVRNGDKFRGTYGAFAGNIDEAGSTFHADSGSAARFFWCPKTAASDRHEGLQHPGQQFQNGSTLRAAENLPAKGNHHPTVKPTELMRYLCRLVTPPGGTVLDPFMGSGSTLKAAELEGFSAIGIELDPAYVEIARSRIAGDAPLFADIEVTA